MELAQPGLARCDRDAVRVFAEETEAGGCRLYVLHPPLQKGPEAQPCRNRRSLPSALRLQQMDPHIVERDGGRNQVRFLSGRSSLPSAIRKPRGLLIGA